MTTDENFVSIICSEKQGSDAGMAELYRLGIMKATFPPLTFTVNTGMISRVFYDEQGKITKHEVVDKFGTPIKIPHGTFPEEGCEGSLPGDLPEAAGIGQHRLLQGTAAPVELWRIQKGPRMD